MKVCTKCAIAKPLASFHKGRAQCAECRNAYGVRWRADNPGRQAELSLCWRKENPLMNLAAVARWKKANPDKVRLHASVSQRRHAEAARIRKRRWQRAHPDKNSAKSARRQAAKLQATPGWTNHVAVGEFYALAAIKTRLTGKLWHVDHIVPLKSPLVCGLHTHYNLDVLLGGDNVRKGNRVWPDMPGGQ